MSRAERQGGVPGEQAEIPARGLPTGTEEVEIADDGLGDFTVKGLGLDVPGRSGLCVGQSEGVVDVRMRGLLGHALGPRIADRPCIMKLTWPSHA